ncbi:amidohydrolase family protein [Nocardioides houyundeii]|uniref:amidohydrolase family protein n=1 Tax=Nocardioides houyundeii TaxID=2045452 RepID=UPI000DF28E91|nr:amidohydrolase family protein [Nocardioides houyundeii]
MFELEDGRVIEVVDAQVHLNKMGTVATGVAAMDAVGIDVAVIDEWRGFDDNAIKYPHRPAPRGGVRHENPFSVDALMHHPTRLSYLGAVDRADPDLADVVRDIANDPGQAGLRVYCGPRPGDHEAFAQGRYDPIFEACGEYGVTVMVIVSRMGVPDRYDLLLPRLERFTTTRFVIDHCGVFPLSGDDVDGATMTELLAPLELLKDLAHVGVKWCRAPEISRRPFPFDDVDRQLRRCLDLLGAGRVMWASDHTQTGRHHSWAEALYTVGLSQRLSPDEKERVLGGTAREFLNLPASTVDRGGRVTAEVSG